MPQLPAIEPTQILSMDSLVIFPATGKVFAQNGKHNLGKEFAAPAIALSRRPEILGGRASVSWNS